MVLGLSATKLVIIPQTNSHISDNEGLKTDILKGNLEQVLIFAGLDSEILFKQGGKILCIDKPRFDSDIGHIASLLQ